MNEKNQFTEGKIFGPLIRFALPVLLALFLQTMYGAVDLLVVGQFGEAADVSAVGTGSQMMQMITGIVSGLAMGITILLGQAIGKKRPDEAGDIIGSGICFFFVLALIITVLMMFLTKPFAVFMQAPAEAFDKTVGYVLICSLGAVFIVSYNVLGSIFRGLGDSKTPLLAVFIACVFNIAGDLFFVAVLHMAAEGAAIATVMAQAFSVVLCAVIVKKRGLPFPFSRKNIRFNGNVTGKILRMGIPIALQDFQLSLSFLVIISIVNSLGVIASAGVGVAEKLCGFIMLVPSSFMQALAAVVAQNIGAGKKDRAKKAMACGMAASFATGVVMFYFAFFHGDLLSAVFSSDQQVILASADYLKAYAIDTLIVSFKFCLLGYFNGCGKTAFVMVQGIVGAFGVRIPVSWVMSKMEPVSLFRIGLATPTATVVELVLCVVYFVWTNKKTERERTETLEE